MSDIYAESFEFLYNNHSSRSRHRVCLIERARPDAEEYRNRRGTSQRRDARLFQNKKTAFDFVTSSTKMFASTKTSFRAANASDDGSLGPRRRTASNGGDVRAKEGDRTLKRRPLVLTHGPLPDVNVKLIHQIFIRQRRRRLDVQNVIVGVFRRLAAARHTG